MKLWPRRAERIARAADTWVARSQRPLSTHELLDRETWRSADPAHEQAWQRAQHLMAATAAMRRPAASLPEHEQNRRGPATAFAGFAAVIAAVGGVILLERSWRHEAPTIAEWVATDQPSHIRLVDGTIVDLGSGSAVRADMSGQVRAVLLERGTARFDVARDADRPFVVSASDRKVTAIGTRFEVAMHSDGIVVTLFQGAIEVTAKTSQHYASPIRMHRGQRLTVADGRTMLTTTSLIERPADTAAQDVAPTPVGEIIEQANRTARVPIRLANPAIASRRVEGRFDMGNSYTLAQQLAAALDLVLSQPDGVYLLSSR